MTETWLSAQGDEALICMTVCSEVAQIFHEGEQTSVIASHQQMNGV